MKRLLLLFFFATTLRAAEVEVGARYLTVITSEPAALDVATSLGFGASAEVFWSERFSTAVAAEFAQPAAILLPAGGGDLDLGTLGIEPVTLTGRWHFAPVVWRLAPYVGMGGAVVFLGNLDDRFGDELEVDFDPELTWVVEAGVRWRVRERVALEFGAAYMPVTAEPNVIENASGAPLPDWIELDPIVAHLGVSWRF